MKDGFNDKMSAPDFRVVLLGNYAHDRQQSMQRFTQLMLAGLLQHGIPAEVCPPAPVFGRLKPAASGVGKWLGYIDKFVVFPFVLLRTIARGKAAGQPSAKVIVHVCDHSNAHYTRYLGKVAHLVTCHDLLAVRQALGEFAQSRVSVTGRSLQQMILRGLRRAVKIVCVSSATAADVRRIVGRKGASVEVVLNGLNYPYQPMLGETARERLTALLARHGREASGGPYILHVGGNNWYKNRLGVLEIYAALRRDWSGKTAPPRLLLAGAPLTVEMEGFLRAQPEWSADVVALTGVDDNEDLRALYSMAELLLFPSLEEGFGWPISEAQACGCRVVTTGKSPMTEVGGAAAIYLEPEAVNGAAADGFTTAARAVFSLLQESEAARRERIEAGMTNAQRFSPDEMIRRYIRVYRELVALKAPVPTAAIYSEA
jgi:glycosyltransferase involved in cell wall biosynthesis